MIKIIWIYGLPGSGKSYISNILSEKTGFEKFDSDDYEIRSGLEDNAFLNTVGNKMIETYWHSNKKTIIFSSLKPIFKQGVYTVGLMCPLPILLKRKPDYWNKYLSGKFHKEEKLTYKSIDTFIGFEMADLVIDTTKPTNLQIEEILNNIHGRCSSIL